MTLKKIINILSAANLFIITACNNLPTGNQCRAVYSEPEQRLDCINSEVFPDIPSSIQRGMIAGAVLGGVIGLVLSKGKSTTSYIINGVIIGTAAGAATAYLRDLASRSGNNPDQVRNYNSFYYKADLNKFNQLSNTSYELYRDTKIETAKVETNINNGNISDSTLKSINALNIKVKKLQETVLHMRSVLDVYKSAFSELGTKPDQANIEKEKTLRRQLLEQQSLIESLNERIRLLSSASGVTIK